MNRKLEKLYTYEAMQVHFAMTLMNKQKDGYKTTSILFSCIEIAWSTSFYVLILLDNQKERKHSYFSLELIEEEISYRITHTHTQKEPTVSFTLFHI